MLTTASGRLRGALFVLSLPALVFLLAACGEKEPLGAALHGESELIPAESAVTNPAPPPGRVTVTRGGESCEFWPWTGMGLDGVPSDPINLVFTGKADPVQIREALLGLNGDRTSFGFPDVFPFNGRWSDAQGDLQTTWAEADGWVGSVIQLQMGDFDKVRVHLRLFRTGKAAADGCWTLGAAHFEVYIPGTADHQVLDWELAEQIVTVDLIRSGLLESNLPSGSTGPINQAPSFREIPDYIYNNLPEALIDAINGPPAPVSGAVPIDSDGEGTLFHLTGSVPVEPATKTYSMTINYSVVAPKPFCAAGPLDFVFIEGPVDFVWVTTVDGQGCAHVSSRYQGRLTATPMDVTVNPPVPAGAPYPGQVSGVQSGFTGPLRSEIMGQTKRIAPGAGGAEMFLFRVQVGGRGADSYRASTKCLIPE